MALAADRSIAVRVVGRNENRGKPQAERAGAQFHQANIADKQALHRAIEGSLVVVHAAGPFQTQQYDVANACIAAGAHYMDLADGREFVLGIGSLDALARSKNLLVTSGVSSVPAITSAMFGELASEFTEVDRIHIALSPGNQNPRGDSTIAAVMSYLDKPIRVWSDGAWTTRQGWDDKRVLEFPAKVGRRSVYNCDVPDLELFPARTGARTVYFQAGLELPALNHAIAFAGWISRKTGANLMTQAGFFRKVSLLLYPFGSKNGSLAMWVTGRNSAGSQIERRIAIVTDNDGPATPSAAAIVLTRRIVASGAPAIGAMPCFGLLKFRELMQHLSQYGVWSVRGDASGWWQRSDNSHDTLQ